MPEQACAAVILAAGASTRLGQPKQRIQLGGESLLRRTARLAVEAGCAPVLVVLGFQAEQMRPELEGLAVRAVVNDSWVEGMGSSLRRGVEALGQTQPHPGAALVLVCDQPRLTLDHLRQLRLIHSEGNAPITASSYGGRAGVPAVFAEALFPQLAAAAGDRGARDLIRQSAGPIRVVAWPDGELDLDCPEDLDHLRLP